MARSEVVLSDNIQGETLTVPGAEGARQAAVPHTRSKAEFSRLIVNADDLGWSKSVNLGIFESHENGIVTSASLIADGPAFADAVARAAATPTFDIGVHLNIYRGEPVLPSAEIPTLTGEDGNFLGSVPRIVTRLLTGAMSEDQIEAEFRAQIEKVRGAGIIPSHLDSEKHLHLWPSIFRIVCRLACEYGVETVRLVREPTFADPLVMALDALSVIDSRVLDECRLHAAHRTIGVAQAPTDLAKLSRLLAGVRGRDVEFIVHPGHVDDEFWELQGTVPNKLDYSREQQSQVLATVAARRLAERHACVLQRRKRRADSTCPVS